MNPPPVIDDEARARIRTCLDYIRQNPDAFSTPLAAMWRREVTADARRAGLLPAEPARIGCNVPRNPFPAVYGGDMPDVF